MAPRNLRRVERCEVASLAGSSSGRDEERNRNSRGEILIASNIHSVNGAENLAYCCWCNNVFASENEMLGFKIQERWEKSKE